jgi:hypothetical protein
LAVIVWADREEAEWKNGTVAPSLQSGIVREVCMYVYVLTIFTVQYMDIWIAASAVAIRGYYLGR